MDLLSLEILNNYFQESNKITASVNNLPGIYWSGMIHRHRNKTLHTSKVFCTIFVSISEIISL